MPPKLSNQQIAGITELVAQYIAEQRALFWKRAQPIGEQHRTKLQAFFPAALLDKVRVVKGRAGEPSFYPKLRAMGIENAPAFSDMAGITFQDVVVHSDRLSEPLLFHELVHAMQYEHLGLEGFAERYVRGFLTGGSYEEIPLEKQAYQLEAKFVGNPRSPFSVEADVLERIHRKQL